MTPQAQITEAYSRWNDGELTNYELSLIVSSVITDWDIQNFNETTVDAILECAG